jgi:hypothetical protein
LSPHRFGDEAVPILVHQPEEPLGPARLPHELLKGQAAVLRQRSARGSGEATLLSSS